VVTSAAGESIIAAVSGRVAEDRMAEGERAAGGATLAIVRAITAIDEDGDAAWRVLAASSETHTLRRLLAEWSELAAPSAAIGEGVGVASPLLFVAAGPPAWARRQAAQIRREADALLTRLRLGETDLADEMGWLLRPLQRRAVRFNAEVWRALALRQLLEGEELSALGWVEGSADDRWLAACYAVPPDADAEELEGLAGRALEAWLYISEG
jgi:hypothetical protein